MSTVNVTSKGNSAPPAGGWLIEFPNGDQCQAPPPLAGPGFPGMIPSNCGISVSGAQNLDGDTGTVDVILPSGAPSGAYGIVVIGPPLPFSDDGYIYAGTFSK